MQLVLSAQEMEPVFLSVCPCTMSWVLSELPRLKFWYSHEKTIEIIAKLFSMQCAVWRSETMQVVARYIEDRSVDARHVAVKGDRNVIKLVSMCLDDWFGVWRGDKEGCTVAHMFATSLGAPACECSIPAGSLSLSSQL